LWNIIEVVSPARQSLQPTVAEAAGSSAAKHPMDLSELDLERLRLKLRYKVLYHVGHN
jgi:hypothetical protein